MNIKETTIGFIGSGKMAEAMIYGLTRKGIDRNRILASGPKKERAEFLSKEYGIVGTTNNARVARTSDIVILSVKPQIFSEVFEEVYGEIRLAKIIVSIAAGIPLSFMGKIDNRITAVRAMPNTPCHIGKGVTVWTASGSLLENHAPAISDFLGIFGDEIRVTDEKYIDMATAISGSGPAYVFLFLEAMTEAGVRIGLPWNVSKRLALETVIGASEYAKDSENHLAELRNEVCSPGGVTVRAIEAFERGGLRTTVLDAVIASYEATLALGQKK